MSKILPPLSVRDNVKDEAVRKASDPAYAYDYQRSLVRSEALFEKMLNSNFDKPEPTDVKVTRRPGRHVPMANEGPHMKWPGTYPDRK